MHAQLPPQLPSLTDAETDAEDLRRRVAHELYQRLAFASFAIWTGGCLMLFILFAANSPSPIFPAMYSMTVPLIPAALVWLLYRPLVHIRTARALRAATDSHP